MPTLLGCLDICRSHQRYERYSGLFGIFNSMASSMWKTIGFRKRNRFKGVTMPRLSTQSPYRQLALASISKTNAIFS